MTKSKAQQPQPLPRLTTGLAGLDLILHGGLLKGGIYVVSGRPGSGKTILANQISFHHIATGGRALYATVLAEAHGRMVSVLAPMTFFDPSRVGQELRYVSAFTEASERGLAGLMEVLRNSVRSHQASLLVIDGIITASGFARSELDYKMFIHELQTWAAMMGCTVLILGSTDLRESRPEDTMVDGLFHLQLKHQGHRTVRQFWVSKFRGSGFTEGHHAYLISDAGVTIYPRAEAALRTEDKPARGVPEDKVSTGVPGLDDLVGGGLAMGSTTLLLGASGAGKTLMGMQYLAEGARRKEPSLHFGFFETPTALRAKARRLKLSPDAWEPGGLIQVSWQPQSEGLLDVLAERLLSLVERHRIRRLFIDGLVGFKETEAPERLSSYLAIVSAVLTERGVTTLITEETRQLYVDDVEIPTSGVSASIHNILFLRQVEVDSNLVHLISVMKTRDTGHAQALHELEHGARGLKIGKPFRGESELIRGRGLGARRGMFGRRRKAGKKQ